MEGGKGYGGGRLRVWEGVKVLGEEGKDVEEWD